MKHAWNGFGDAKCMLCGVTRNEVDDNLKPAECPGRIGAPSEPNPTYFRAALIKRDGAVTNVSINDDGSMELRSMVDGARIVLDLGQRRMLQKISEQF